VAILSGINGGPGSAPSETIGASGNERNSEWYDPKSVRGPCCEGDRKPLRMAGKRCCFRGPNGFMALVRYCRMEGADELSYTDKDVI
jgi:hypothetical protein